MDRKVSLGEVKLFAHAYLEKFTQENLVQCSILVLKFGFLTITLVKSRLVWSLGWSKTEIMQGHKWLNHLLSTRKLLLIASFLNLFLRI